MTIPLDVITIINLPSHLRMTALAIVKLGEGSASEVADETRRLEELERHNMEELFKLDYLNKKTVGLKEVYSI